MKILFATAQPFPPQMYGGLQACVSALIHSLNARGRSSTLLCALTGEGWLGLRGRLMMKLFQYKAAPDNVLGHSAWRTWFPWDGVEFVTRRIKPDLVVIPARLPVRMAMAAKKAGIPVLMWLQDVEFKDHGGDFRALGNIPCVANSSFTAERFRKAYGIQPIVIHPLIDAEKYKTNSSRENVTFINPHPVKGVVLALAIAEQCPEIPFSFIETWPLSDQERVALLEKIEKLPNVKLHPPTADMKTVYGKAKILLVPSQWEEAFGRVASEAQFSGIPVVASDRGGLPEAVGPGGILLNPEGTVIDWINAIKQLWHDEAHYTAMSEKAYQHAVRPALNPDIQIRSWEEALASAMKQAQTIHKK